MANDKSGKQFLNFINARNKKKYCQLSAFFKVLDSNLCNNPFIGSTKILQRRAAPSFVQFLALAAIFHRLFLASFFNNRYVRTFLTNN